MKGLAIILLCSAVIPGVAAAQSFGGYPCTQDCSGHEAGYDWADRRGIDSVDDCGGNSNSFIEGCQAYVEQNQPATNGATEDGLEAPQE